MGNLRAFLLTFVFLGAWAVAPAHAQDPGPMFLVIALDNADGTAGTFDVSEIKTKGKDAGSNTIIVKVGTLSGGDQGATDVALSSDDPSFPLPKVQGQYIDLGTLAGNQATYFGTYEVYDYNVGSELQPHMLTTASGSVDPAIQVAVWAAAASLETAIESDPFMKTGEIAGIVYDELSSDAKQNLSLDAVAKALFGFSGDETPPLLTQPNPNEALVECEGDLFPHEDPAVKLFDFTFSLTKANNGKSAKFTLESLIITVDVVVKESSVNSEKQGNLPVAVYSKGGFDAANVVESSVYLFVVGGNGAGVQASSTSLSDQNDDGIDDLVCNFSVPDLKTNGLSTSTTKVTLEADLDDGKTSITGTASINVTK